MIFTGRVYQKYDHRKAFEGILYKIRTGCPWSDIPDYFGDWSAIYRRFNLWSKKGIYRALKNDPELEWVFIDGTIVKAHQHCAGAATDNTQSIGKSVAGNTTKIHMAVDSYGLPIEFTLTGGEVDDSKEAINLIDLLPSCGYIIADKGYDSETIREQISDKLSLPVIPRKQNSKVGNTDIDWCLYKYRHLVDNVFARLKQYRGIATRYDKLQVNYESTVALGCSMIWLSMSV
ncbi:IS5 family transposase [Psychrobium sp. nBUS_13]|uniref:IS5 family transposase n=1 Tax=Psychrobium sp. nBUS_13 TaxID=3395319 RepID=UPI003EBE90BC